jgi:NAD(P)-dependent dehydrogenase (short-subunit alcohol dehydrogenase family)
MTMGESLKGKVALVPGSGQGIGRAIPRPLQPKALR